VVKYKMGLTLESESKIDLKLMVQILCKHGTSWLGSIGYFPHSCTPTSHDLDHQFFSTPPHSVPIHSVSPSCCSQRGRQTRVLQRQTPRTPDKVCTTTTQRQGFMERCNIYSVVVRHVCVAFIFFPN
jgi:hypothetical protein